MLFQADITIAKETTKAKPQVETLKIAHGIISQITVQIRAGHQNLAHLVIYHGGHQIAPSTQGMDIHGDFFPVDWQEYYEFYQPPFELKLVGWNDDDTFPHTFTVYVAILPRKAIIAFAVADALKKVIGVFLPRKILSKDKGK